MSMIEENFSLRQTHFDFAGRGPSGRVVRPTGTHEVVECWGWTTWWQRQSLPRLNLVNHRTVPHALEWLYAVRQYLPHTHGCTYMEGICKVQKDKKLLYVLHMQHHKLFRQLSNIAPCLPAGNLCTNRQFSGKN